MGSLDEELSTNSKASNVFSGMSSPSCHYQWIDPADFEPLNSLNVTEAEALGQIGMFGRPRLITDEVNSQINPDETLADSFIVHP